MSDVLVFAYSAGDLGFNPWVGEDLLAEGNGNPTPVENPTDGEAGML